MPVLILLGVGAIGAGTATLRSYSVWAPALSYPYYGEVQGVIQGIDRSASGSLRVTLRVAAMEPISERHRPQYVRISFPKYTGVVPKMDQSIQTTAYITPPQGSVEPDGFDFRRHAYFQSLGGVGYARKGFEQLVVCPVSINFGRIINAIYLILLLHIFLNVRWDLRRPLFQAIV